MIVEIVPTDNYLYKLVYAEPLNTTWALRYITLYLSSEDIIEITLVLSKVCSFVFIPKSFEYIALYYSIHRTWSQTEALLNPNEYDSHMHGGKNV